MKSFLKIFKNNNIPVLITGLGITSVYYLIFSHFFPNIHGKIGHDYSQHLPEMLDGYYWFQSNGLFEVPWFTPSFCGGLPAIPNPRNMYYSIPQFLTFIFNPLISIKITLLLFAYTGWHGTYLLLRKIFLTLKSTAMFGATLFLFNGMYASRMLIGHIEFHGFMLIPLVSFLLLEKYDDHDNKMWETLFEIFSAGLIFAYMLLSGMVNLLFPAIITIIIIGLIYGTIYPVKFKLSNFLIRLLFAGGMGICLSSFKIVPMLAFAGYFPRDFYPLPGSKSIFKILEIIFISLFWKSPYKMANAIFVNKMWFLEQQEFEFGVTFVPLVIFLLYAGFKIRKFFTPEKWRKFNMYQWIYLGMSVILLSLPVILNYYTPAFNSFLKKLPLFKSSSSMLRWFSVYIPVVILLSCITIEKITKLKRYHVGLIIICILMIIVWNIKDNRSNYIKQTYDPDLILKAYNRTKSGLLKPKITTIMVYVDQSGEIILPVFRHESIAYGCSQLFCYEPMFGYRQEFLPINILHPGPVLDIQNGYFNIKNPACYIYPKENNCSPGDHFTVDQCNLAKAFINFRPFPFKTPLLQKIANFLSLSTLIIIIQFLSVYIFRKLYKFYMK